MFPFLPKTNFIFFITFILLCTNALKLDQFKILSFGKESIFCPQMLTIQFKCLQYRFNSNLTLIIPNLFFNNPKNKGMFENFVGKGENAGNQHFLLFPQCFLTYHAFSNMYHVICKCFLFGPV